MRAGRFCGSHVQTLSSPLSFARLAWLHGNPTGAGDKVMRGGQVGARGLRTPVAGSGERGAG